MRDHAAGLYVTCDGTTSEVREIYIFCCGAGLNPTNTPAPTSIHQPLGVACICKVFLVHWNFSNINMEQRNAGTRIMLQYNIPFMNKSLNNRPSRHCNIVFNLFVSYRKNFPDTFVIKLTLVSDTSVWSEERWGERRGEPFLPITILRRSVKSRVRVDVKKVVVLGGGARHQLSVKKLPIFDFASIRCRSLQSV